MTTKYIQGANIVFNNDNGDTITLKPASGQTLNVQGSVTPVVIGTDKQVTFNKAGVMSGDVNLTFNSASALLSTINVNASGNLATSKVLVGYGSNLSPSICFTDDSDTGFYRIGANQIATSCEGSVKACFFEGSGASSYFRVGGEEASVPVGFGGAGACMSVAGNGYFNGSANVSRVPFEVKANINSATNQTPVLVSFVNSSNAQIGSIYQSGASSIAIATSSDVRLKNSIEVITNGLETVNKLKPSKFKWNSSGIDDVGFIADEFLKVYPHGGILSSDDENTTEPFYSSIDKTACIADLVSAVQELHTIIKNQQIQINTLLNL